MSTKVTLSRRDQIEIRVFGLLACAVGIFLLVAAVGLFMTRYGDGNPEIVAKVRAGIEDETTGVVSQEVATTLVVTAFLAGFGLVGLGVGSYVTRFSLRQDRCLSGSEE